MTDKTDKTNATEVDDSTPEEIAATIRRLESTVDDLQRQLDELRAERTPPATPAASAIPTDLVVEHHDAPDRRQLLRRAGAATAGALAGGMVMAAGTATPAAAANGGNMILGANNSATNITRLTGIMNVDTSNSTNTFTAEASLANADAIRGLAYGTNGVGVRASSTNGPGLIIQNGTQVIPPQAGTWDVGAFLIAGSHLYYCYSGGTGPASKWARLSTTFVAFDGPIRVYDSRPATQPVTPPKTRFSNHEERTLSLTVNNAIPAGISPTAVAVNLTATNTNPGGYFTAWRSTIPWPGTSSVNWSMANQTIANQSVIRTNGLAQIKVRCEGAGGADLVVDVVGYYL